LGISWRREVYIPWRSPNPSQAQIMRTVQNVPPKCPSANRLASINDYQSPRYGIPYFRYSQNLMPRISDPKIHSSAKSGIRTLLQGPDCQ